MDKFVVLHEHKNSIYSSESLVFRSHKLYVRILDENPKDLPIFATRMTPNVAHIDIRLPLLVLAQAINRTMGQFLSSQADVQGPFTEVQVEQQTPLRLKAENGQLRSEVSIKASVRLRRQAIGISLPIPDLDRVEMVVRTIMHTEIQLTDSWQLASKTTAQFVWEQKPQAVGLIRLPIVPLVEPLLDKQLEDVAAQIDRYISDEVNLRKVCVAAWEHLQQAIPISAEPPAWLSIGPTSEAISYTPLMIGSTFISTQLCLPIEPIVRLSSKEATSLVALSNGLEIDDLPPETTLAVQATIKWEEIAALIQGRTFALDDDAEITVHSAIIQATDETAKLHGSFDIARPNTRWHGARGTCTITMIPAWAPSPAPSIRVVDFAVDMDRKWQKVFGRLVRRRIGRRIGHQLTEWLAADWYRMHGEAMTQIAHLPLGPQLTLATDEPHLEDLRIKWDATGLLIKGTLTGEAHLLIQQIS